MQIPTPARRPPRQRTPGTRSSRGVPGPIRRNHGRNGVARGVRAVGGGGQQRARLGIVHLAQGVQLLAVALQPGLHVVGEAALVERALVGITEDGHRAVVARHDDEAVVVSNVEHIEKALLPGFRQGTGDRHGAQGALRGAFLTTHKRLGFFLRLPHGNGAGMEAGDKKRQCQYKKNFFHRNII